MRNLLISVCTALLYAASILGASAQSSGGFLVQPFTVNQTQFAAGISNLNFPTFFGSGIGQVGINNDPTNGKGLNIRKALTDLETNVACLTLTGLAPSVNPAAGSTGAIFELAPGTNNVRTVSFQYAPLSSTTGLLNFEQTLQESPFLAIVDNNGLRSRLIPVTGGAVATNDALNTFNKSQGNSNPTDATSGFLTVNFTPAQLGISGNVTAIGLVFFRQGILLVKGVQVNGVDAAGISTIVLPYYPFNSTPFQD